jgi:uncharacterized protein YjbI with pentapeptide repeats
MTSEELQRMLTAHSYWLSEQSKGRNAIGYRARLSGVDLTLAKLFQADLRDAYFTNALMFRADLGGANLSGAHMRGADLREANLHGADLRGANLTNADLRGANLTNADLGGATMTLAKLKIRAVNSRPPKANRPPPQIAPFRAVYPDGVQLAPKPHK